jgi:hypothetical protein
VASDADDAASATPVTSYATAAATATTPATDADATPAAEAASCTQRGAGELCGGLGLCGINAACPNICCPADAQCKRYNDFTWLCEQQ